MFINSGFTIPFSDILMFGVIIFFGCYGFKRGVQKELVSVLRLYFSFIITVILYERLAVLVQALFNAPSWLSQMLCFVIIFAIFASGMWVVEIILRKKLSKAEKTGSVLSKTGGVTLGLLEGILIISIMIMAVEFYPTPEGAKYPFEGAVSYKFIKQIAPGIKDFTVRPVSMLKNISDGSKPEDLEEE